MTLRSQFYIATIAILVVAGCGPDAPRDNPLDPYNLGPGVYGTVYRGTGGVITGAVITARPANIATTSDQLGAYSIRLNGGTYYLEAVYNGYRTVVDTVTVPQGGRVQHDFVLRGEVRFDSAGVRTVTVRDPGGTQSYRIVPWCLAYHPDGAGFLDGYAFTCRLDSFVFYPETTVPVDNQRKLYLWSISQLPGVANFPQWVVGRTVEIRASSPSHSLLVPRTVPGFLEPLPHNLYPANGQNFYTPDTLRWENVLTSVNLSAEVCLGLACVWRREIPFNNRVYCDTALGQSGLYTWRVIMRDTYGNEGSAEATFYQPLP
ncbi:MAG TPA: hypothetical protein DDW31_05875 [candidate division Zixibacteria bacterium]|jgi:hypothetical protein|nr:hypothetical protein [candidate division Zixibacteria bacterium]